MLDWKKLNAKWDKVMASLTKSRFRKWYKKSKSRNNQAFRNRQFINRLKKLQNGKV